MEKCTRADIRPIERGSKQDIEIEEGKRRNQEIRLVGTPELHRFDALAFQQKDPGQNDSQQENDREGSKIFWHGENNNTQGTVACWLSGHSGSLTITISFFGLGATCSGQMGGGVTSRLFHRSAATGTCVTGSLLYPGVGR